MISTKTDNIDMSIYPSKASILGALSNALDLVEGQPKGHALRTARIAMRIAQVMGLSEAEQHQLFFASVLKDSGCSNNAVRIQKMFGGDEFLAKREVKLIDWTSNLESIKFALVQTEKGNSLGSKLRRLASNLGHPQQVMDEVTEARCTRGATIAKMLSLPAPVADAIQALDEHWDGNGSPYRLKGDDIPILARILCFCQTFEVFVQAFGLEPAYEMADARNTKWFDPEVVEACRSLRVEGELWEEILEQRTTCHMVDAFETSAMETDIDAICEAFAMIIDAKSSFTAEHSTRVARYAVQIGQQLGMTNDILKLLHRAGLMHDVGKLGISTRILEKPAKLDEEEFNQVKLHPMYSFQILDNISGFEDIAAIASHHHERLDGKGYWQNLTAEQLPLTSRIMTVSDVFDALTAKRPYRDAMPLDKVYEIMEKDLGTAFDASCVSALKAIYPVADELPMAA